MTCTCLIFINAGKRTMTSPPAEQDTELERGRARDLTNILTT